MVMSLVQGIEHGDVPYREVKVVGHGTLYQILNLIESHCWAQVKKRKKKRQGTEVEKYLRSKG